MPLFIVTAIPAPLISLYSLCLRAEQSYLSIGDLSEGVKVICRVQFFKTPWTVAHQAPLSVEFSRQEYWSGLPFPSQGTSLS